MSKVTERSNTMQTQCPRQESNLHPALRRRVLCPLSYEGGPAEGNRPASRPSSTRLDILARPQRLAHRSFVVRRLTRDDKALSLVVFPRLVEGSQVRRGKLIADP